MLTLYYVFFVILITFGASTCHGFQPRIVNGSLSKLGEFPYQVSVQLNKSLLCGGSIIDERHVLTAAHCVQPHKIECLSVVAGSVDLRNKSRHPGSRYEVIDVKVHEKFKVGNGWPNDIALLRLAEPIVFNKYVAPAVLPEPNEELKPGQPAIISGFGRPKLKSPGSPILYKTNVFIESNSECQLHYHTDRIRPTNLCTRHPSRITGTCEGDSGGPIIVQGKVVGISSMSLDNGCAGKSMSPQAHTRVSQYIDWINYWRKS